MNKTIIAVALVSAALFSGTFLFVGCENDKGGTEGAEFRIEPSHVTLNLGQQTAVFMTVGGHQPLTWTVTDASMGAISGSGQTITYTRTALNGVNMIEVTDDKQWVATATVTQTSDTNGTQNVTISPASATIASDGGVAVFTAVGGTPPYHWNVGDSSRGIAVASGPNQCSYTRLATGDNNVIVTDGLGTVASAAITQPAISVVAVSPASSSVSTNGGSVVLTASGGNGAYTWSVSSGPGSVLPGTGNSTVYTFAGGSSTATIIQLTDGITSAFATITKN